MSKDSDKIEIYIKILSYIEEQNSRNFYPKTVDILEYVNMFSDKEVGLRTINRYIHDVCHIFDVSLEKESVRSGYYIDKESSADFKEIYKTIQLFEKAKFFQKIMEESSQALKYFSFDSVEFQGLRWVDSILSAIIDKKVVEITHQRFNNNATSTRKVEPHLIKEYANRWYFVGFDLSKNEFRTFGLDRITKIEILNKNFKTHRTEEIKDRFRKTIGLVYTPPEKVVLEFDAQQGRYFKANPWHKEYTVIKDNVESLIVEMNISINYELEQKILMHNTYVKVLEPKSLIETIILLHKNAIEQYKY